MLHSSRPECVGDDGGLELSMSSMSEHCKGWGRITITITGTTKYTQYGTARSGIVKDLHFPRFLTIREDYRV